MKFHLKTAEIFVPGGKSIAAALRDVTHLGIGAHQDDLEFMAFHGILAGYRQRGKQFAGVTCTNGSGSARIGVYQAFSEAQLRAARRREQNRAAMAGRYAAMMQLDYPSRAVKSAGDPALKNDLKKILAATRPEIVYTHNLADKHETHIGVAVAALQAMRELPRRQRPRRVIGCEVWRSLDWLPDADKVVMDVSGAEALAAELNGLFDSQIAGGKRYDAAIQGRRAANATFLESHAADAATQVIFGMDLTPLVKDETKDIVAYTLGFIEKFSGDVAGKLRRTLGSG